MNEQLLNKYYNNLLTAIDQLISGQKYEEARQFIQDFKEPVIKEFFLAEIELREKINKLSAAQELSAGIENNQPQSSLFKNLYSLFMSRSGILNSADQEAIWYPVLSKQDHLIRSYLYLRMLSLIGLFADKASTHETSWVKQEDIFLKNNKGIFAWQWKGEEKKLPNGRISAEVTKEINFLKKTGFSIAEKIILFKKRSENNQVSNEANVVILFPPEIKPEPVKTQTAASASYAKQFEKNFIQQSLLVLKRMVLSFSTRVLVEKFGSRELNLMGAKEGKIADAPYTIYPHKVSRSLKDRNFQNNVFEKIKKHVKVKKQEIKEQEKLLEENPFCVLDKTSFQQLTTLEVSENSEKIPENNSNSRSQNEVLNPSVTKPKDMKNPWEEYFKEMGEAVQDLKENPNEEKNLAQQKYFVRKYTRTFLAQEIKPINGQKIFIEKHLRFLSKKGPRQQIYANTLLEILQSNTMSEIISKIRTLYVFRLAELGHQGSFNKINIKAKPYSEDSILLVLDDILKSSSVNKGITEFVPVSPQDKLIKFKVSSSFFKSRKTSSEHYYQAIELLSCMQPTFLEGKSFIFTLMLLRKNELIANGKEVKEEWSSDEIYRQLQTSPSSEFTL